MAAVMAASVALAHIVIFVRPQNAVSKRVYWDGQFAPRTGVGPLIAFVWDGLRGFVTSGFTDSYEPQPSVLTSSHVGGILDALWVVLLCLAVVALARPRPGGGRCWFSPSAGLLALTRRDFATVRSRPCGLARTDLWLGPFLVLTAGIGAVETAR